MDTMKATVSNTTFFNSLLGDDMQTQYKIKNPYTGVVLVTCDASELNSFLSYFRGLIGVWDIPYEVVA